MHVLIVDDDALMRNVLTRILQSAGHTTCWASNGAGGLRLLRSEKIDVMILDINLGVDSMSGWDVAREKLLDPTIRGIPVIVLSGMTPEDVRSGARATADALSGATLILGKPVDNTTLLKALALLEGDRVTPVPPTPKE